jgi:thiamine-monophosphate kinase
MNNRAIENLLVERRVARFPRSPLQLNQLGESDAELVRLPGSDALLAISTDAVVEEIETGLYRDPWLIGWMSVMVSASDLAAVGAEPIGILLSQTLPTDLDPAWETRLQKGIEDACLVSKLYPLGGDTNSSSGLHMESTAIGLVPDGEAMLRSGGAPGDHLFTTGRFGLGSAFAAREVGVWSAAPPIDFRPNARLVEGQLLRTFASCCMDTSDGALATLDELMLRSRTGIQLTRPASDLLHPAAQELSRVLEIPDWIPLAGPHGEFELIFGVPSEKIVAFRVASAAAGLIFLPVGILRQEPGLQRAPEDGGEQLDTSIIRNLAHRASEDVVRFLSQLVELDART